MQKGEEKKFRGWRSISFGINYLSVQAINNIKQQGPSPAPSMGKCFFIHGGGSIDSNALTDWSQDNEKLMVGGRVFGWSLM